MSISAAVLVSAGSMKGFENLRQQEVAPEINKQYVNIQRLSR